MAGVRRLDRDGDYYPLPRNRKIILGVILSLTFINTVVVVATIVRPVPQYSSSGALLELQAQNALSFSKRWMLNKRKELDSNQSLAVPFLGTEADAMPTASSLRARKESIIDDCGCSTGLVVTSQDWPTSTTFTSKGSTSTNTGIYHTHNSKKSKATHTGANSANLTAGDSVNINEFVAIWLGTLGICLQRAEGTLVCTGASL